MALALALENVNSMVSSRQKNNNFYKKLGTNPKIGSAFFFLTE